LHKKQGEAVAERWNIVAAIGLGGFYVLANLVIFVPAWCKQRSAVAQLSGYKRESAAAQVERTSVDSSEQNPMIDQPRGGGEGEATPPLTVRKGHNYITLSEVRANVH
jgi:hypothetical protein